MRRNEILLDTHIILWMIAGDQRLSQKARNIIKESLISGIDFMHYCEQSGYHKLPVDDLHVKGLASLERDEGAPPHNDPFDRIMLSQAKAEGFTFLTHDPFFRGYNESCVVEV